VTPLLLAALLSTANASAAHGPCCIRRATPKTEAARAALATVAPAAPREKTAVRTEAPQAEPATVFRITLQRRSCDVYAAPSLAPRTPAATPSSQRDPPEPLA
jgi:hypothetical protein